VERKNPRWVVALASFWLALIPLGTLGHKYAIFAEAVMVAIFALILVEFLRPQLQLRKPLPKPEIKLNLSGPPN
jgi:hypothetical protein